MPVPRTPIRRRRTIAIAIASSVTLVVGACGGADEPVDTIAATEDAADEAAAPTTGDAPPSTDTESDAEVELPEADAGDPATEPDDEPEPEAPTAEPEPEAPAGPNDLPAVVVRDVATGDEVDLSSFAPGELPFVVWFYAPH